MSRIARACLALMLMSIGCGDDGEVDPVTSPIPAGATPQTSPVTAGQGTDPQVGQSAIQDAGASSVGLGVNYDAGVISTPLDAATSPADAGAPDAGRKLPEARAPITLETPKASVMCGTSACDTQLNVCCESWSATKGFGSSSSCVTREQCYKQYGRSGDQNRAVPHECDGKEDCSGGQVCCLIVDSMPLCNSADFAMCGSKPTGPGGGGLCTDDALCQLGSRQFVALGLPLGILACNDDSDCQDRKGTTCQPEQDGSLSTGKGIKARPYVKVCR